METIICSVGSEARGNPGSAAIGVHITDAAGQVLAEEARAIGNAGAAFAEYNAVMIGLQILQSLYGEKTATTQFEINLSYDHVVKQLNSELPITDPGLVPMFIEIHNMRVIDFPYLKFKLTTPAGNIEVMKLVTEVLD